MPEQSGDSSEQTAAVVSSSNESKEHLGIPKAEFIEDVQSYLDKYGKGDTETVLRQLDAQLMKYNVLNTNLMNRRNYLKNQIPELEKTLQMIRLLMKKRDEQLTTPMQTRFLLSEHVFADAEIEKIDRVGLWLGVNVMVEYPLDEALVLIQDNHGQVTKSEAGLTNDLQFLRDQITTLEVSMARVYNYTVEKRQAAAKAAGGSK